MEVIDAINNRRSIRHFNNLEVNKADIKSIIEAGIKSPSAHNKQPWHFIVIENKELKNDIGDILLKETSLEVKLTSDVIKECSALILVFMENKDELMGTLSIGACIENMLIRATDLNIGSLWIGYIKEIGSIIERKFNKKEKLVSAIALGYMDKIPKMRPRKDIREIVEWIGDNFEKENIDNN